MRRRRCGCAGANVDGLPQRWVRHASPVRLVADRVADLIETHDVLAVGAHSAGPMSRRCCRTWPAFCETPTPFVGRVGSPPACAGCSDAAMSSPAGSSGLIRRLTDALKAAKKHKVVDAWCGGGWGSTPMRRRWCDWRLRAVRAAFLARPNMTR